MPDRSRSFWLLLLAAIALGAFLRLHLITDQIPLDDEWHGLDYTIASSCGEVFTHYTRAGASSVPMNLYHCLLRQTLGWSELTLILPSLLAGLLALALFPLGVARLLGKRTAMIFALLLATSPLLVLYSRVGRAYGAVALLGFLALLALLRWVQEGGRRPAAAYAILGGLAIWFHPFAAVSVLAPLGLALILKLLHGLRGWPRAGAEIAPGARTLALVGLAAIVLPAGLLLPGLLQRLPSIPLSSAEFSLDTMGGLLVLLAGTANPVLVLLFWGLFAAGVVALFDRSRLLGSMLLAIPLLFVPAILVLTPNLAHWPIVLARYLIVFLPVVLALVGLGLDALLRRIESAVAGARGRMLGIVLAVCLLAGLLVSGPLSEAYSAPNSFTSHSAYQDSYRDIDWSHSYQSKIFRKPWVLQRERIPDFYHRLADEPQARPIIEYPMMVGNHFNLLYYYQHFHGRPVRVGYRTDLPLLSERSRGYAFSDGLIDHVIGRSQDHDDLRFANLVDLGDPDAIRNSGAQYLVLHRKPMGEFFPDRFRSGTPLGALVDELAGRLRTSIGPPMLEDEWLVVFLISSASAS